MRWHGRSQAASRKALSARVSAGDHRRSDRRSGGCNGCRQRTLPYIVRFGGAARLGGVIVCGGAATRIRPHQHYVGLTNGQRANATIYVVCPGPAMLNRTGPPAGNQTVSVERVRRDGGDTGSIGHEIWAEFNGDLIHVVRFGHYRAPEAIPPSLQLPCQGTGTVTFTTCFGTLPCAVDARDDVVPVRFINIAA
jgi:hypothetical protein